MRPSEIIPWFAGVDSLKYIGPASTEALKRLLRVTREVEEVAARPPVLRDLVFHLPRAVVDRRVVTPIANLKKGEYAVIEATITEHAPPPRSRNKLPYRIAANDDSGLMTLTFFSVKGDYLSRQYPVGSKMVIGGTVEMYHGHPTMAHPDIAAPVEKADQVLRLAPEYPLTAGLSHKVLNKAVLQALSRLKPLPEWQDAAFMAEHGFAPLLESLKRLHQPEDAFDISPEGAPRKRLAYDELLANQLATALARALVQRQESYAITQDAALEARIKAALPFALTAGQEQVLADIAADMATGHRMTRLLQGDVGSGKTILAFMAMAQAVAAGYQACLMAPTDLLARQHLESLTPLAGAIGIRIGLLSGKMKKSEQAAIIKQVASGELNMLIGTHALFQEQVEFQSLALMVVDEQHRFGVAERMRLAAKGKQPHLLQMSATPIPRSLGMTLYGDMEISNLTERPPGRKPIDTRAVPGGRDAEVIDGIARVMAAGEKAYWVCPLIEAQDEEIGRKMRSTPSSSPLGGLETRAAPPTETPFSRHSPRLSPSEFQGVSAPPQGGSYSASLSAFPRVQSRGLDLAAAEERFAELSKRFPGKVGLVHGRMKLAEREKVMQAFAFGQLQLLVATTVVEVGVNVPEATVMVIEHAERFGLAQLHQLRGRVGRSDKPSRCILLYHDPISQLAKSRLNILRETNDGFVIAEEDLRLRGAGDMLGTQQTGLPDFVLADVSVHLSLLKIAHDDAKLILHRDPDLLGERGRALRLLLALFEYDAAIAQLKAV